MKINPLIKEIRDYRDQLAIDCEYDMHKLYDFHKKREKKLSNPIAKIKPVQPILEVAERETDYNTTKDK